MQRYVSFGWLLMPWGALLIAFDKLDCADVSLT
jgi:hypothetical protein